MKRFVFSMMCVALVFVAGCASTGRKKNVDSEEDIKRNQELLNAFREAAKKPIYVEKCGNELDPLCDSCNNVYDRVAKHNVKVFEQLRGTEVTEELTRSFWEGSTEEEVKQKATNRIAEMAESDKAKYDPATMVALAKDQFCFESYTAYKKELKDAADDAARNEITEKAKADAAYWARLEAGKAIFEKRFNKETCDEYLGVFDALRVAVQEATNGIVSSATTLIDKYTAEANKKLEEEKARIKNDPNLNFFEVGKRITELTSSTAEQLAKDLAPLKDIISVAKKQGEFELKTIAWAKEQTELMKSYNE